MRKFLFLSQAQRFSDFALLLLRIFAGLFLIWSAWDHLSSPERMQEFVGFLEKHEFPSPRMVAPLSVYLQLAIGIAFVLGLVTRWAGIFCVITFVVAIVMVDRFGGVRGVFPSGCLVFIGLYLATHGAGRYSLDAALGANEVARRASGGVRLMR